MKFSVAFVVLALSIIEGVNAADGRCVAAMSVSSAGQLGAAATVGAMGVKPRPMLVPSIKAVQAGIVAAQSVDQATPFPYGTAEEFAFSTPLGSGKWSVATAQDGKTYFTTKVQFNHEVAMDDFVFGTELELPLTASPATYRRIATLANRILGAGAELDLNGEQPFFTAPAISNAVAVHVSKEAPAGLGTDIPHDTSLYDGGVGYGLAHYKNAANRVGKAFSTGVWWTFVIRQRIDLATNAIEGFKWLNLDSLTNYQPTQYMLKDKSTDEYLMSLDLWTPTKAAGFATKHCT